MELLVISHFGYEVAFNRQSKTIYITKGKRIFKLDKEDIEHGFIFEIVQISKPTNSFTKIIIGDSITLV